MIKIDIFSGFLGAGKTTLIKKLLADGYTIVPISELIYKNNYTIDHKGEQIPNEINTSSLQTSSAKSN